MGHNREDITLLRTLYRIAKARMGPKQIETDLCRQLVAIGRSNLNMLGGSGYST